MHKWDPEVYEKSSSEQQRWARELISKLGLGGGERMLDIGCGDGKITAELAARVPRGFVVGLDLSEEMIRFARERFPLSSHSNLRFMVGDASKLEFKEEFDLVVSFACLHWVKDHLPVLEGIRKSLLLGGRVLLQCGGRGNAAEVFEVAEQLIRGRWSRYFQGFEYPYYFYGPEEYKEWVEMAGLKPLRLELVSKDMVQPGRAGLAAWIRSTWHPYTERAPEDLREEFVSDLVEGYISSHPLDEAGGVHVRMMRLEVEAEKVG